MTKNKEAEENSLSFLPAQAQEQLDQLHDSPLTIPLPLCRYIINTFYFTFPFPLRTPYSVRYIINTFYFTF
jgi:hypothetical protein